MGPFRGFPRGVVLGRRESILWCKGGMDGAGRGKCWRCGRGSRFIRWRRARYGPTVCSVCGARSFFVCITGCGGLEGGITLGLEPGGLFHVEHNWEASHGGNCSTWNIPRPTHFGATPVTGRGAKIRGRQSKIKEVFHHQAPFWPLAGTAAQPVKSPSSSWASPVRNAG